MVDILEDCTDSTPDVRLKSDLVITDRELSDPALLSLWLAPKKYPLAAWPLPIPLVSQQQALVNALVCDFPNPGVFMLEKPAFAAPLLRALLAHVLTERAAQLTSFPDPDEARNALDTQLSGYEWMIVSGHEDLPEDIREILLNPDAEERSWTELRLDFIKQYNAIKNKIAALEKIHQIPSRLQRITADIERLKEELIEAQQTDKEAGDVYLLTLEDEKRAKAKKVQAEREWKAIRSVRPWFLARWLNTKTFQEWKYAAAVRQCAVRDTAKEFKNLEKLLDQAFAVNRKCTIRHKAVENHLTQQRAALQKTLDAQKLAEADLGNTLVNETFFEKDRLWESTVPWINAQLESERRHLFALALQVLRAFNIDPVATTNLASVDTLTETTPPRTFGWVWVEASDDHPAIAALTRCGQRVIVVEG